MSGKSIVISTVMDITASITCELIVILQRKCINVDVIYRPRYETGSNEIFSMLNKKESETEKKLLEDSDTEYIAEEQIPNNKE